MSKRCRIAMTLGLVVIVITSGLAPLVPVTVRAQDGCANGLPPRLVVGGSGQVSFTDGLPLNVRAAPGLSGAQVTQLPEGTAFSVIDGPVCADAIYWWQIDSGGVIGWIAESADGTYYVEPVAAPAVPVPDMAAGSGPFTTWDWAAFIGEWGSGLPDPLAITPPDVYAGDLPGLPIDLNAVTFVDDAALSEAQRALLAQNGFVVVPAGLDQFDEAYREGENWTTVPPSFDYDADASEWGYGHAYVVTTDAMLHALHFIFNNLLTDLEKQAFQYIIASDVLVPTLVEAHRQRDQLGSDAALVQAGYNAELYLAVALELFRPGDPARLAAEGTIDPDVAADAESIAALALAGEGQNELPFAPGYTEDFSQYRPRGHYDGDVELEQYFRGVMWLSRITFRANNDNESLIALLLTQALQAAPGAAESWRTVDDMLSFLVGPVDDLGPPEYSHLINTIWPGLPLDQLAGADRLAAFREAVAALPAPRVNGLILPDDTTTDEIAELTQGFRFLGQRFTFDAYIMQQVMYPYVGLPSEPRLLPMGLDIAAVLGSDTAYTLAGEAGATAFVNYDTQQAALRSELNGLTQDNWLENSYGGWLWTLKPLLERDPAAYPPVMNTDAWQRRDIQTGLASWTELKHDTVLYAKQATGFGGGGMPLTSYGYVEPNPLVFARIAVVATMTYQGLIARDLDQVVPHEMGYDTPDMAGRLPGLAAPDAAQFGPGELFVTLDQLRQLAVTSAGFAEIARKELTGEPLSENDYWSILGVGNYLYVLLMTLFQYQPDSQPDPVALVTDVASNPSIQAVLQEAVGGVDYIYMVVPAPDGGLQLVRGGVFSYYEFVGDINQRLTDDEWRSRVRSGDLPPRPVWVNAFLAD
ncbi:MAG: DUF3160 domain-containing protein [Anaerolineae bacterium]|nr:DUF3160 domain-containing protein [Anaerolineae bacterium]